MGITHSEFNEMYSCLEREIPIPLSEAIDKWNKIKDTGLATMNEWIKTLEDKVKDHMDNGYSVGTAMIEAWNESYEVMSEDSDRWFFHISDLRDTFFNNSLNKLEAYEDNLIDKASRYPCKDCGWFVCNHQKKEGHCNNFSIKRNKNSKCVSEEE